MQTVTMYLRAASVKATLVDEWNQTVSTLPALTRGLRAELVLKLLDENGERFGPERLNYASCPVSPVGPFGILKSRTAAEDVPELCTSAGLSDATISTDPTSTVAAVPVRPCGIPNLNTASFSSPTFSTVAALPAGSVPTSPTSMVERSPRGPGTSGIGSLHS